MLLTHSAETGRFDATASERHTRQTTEGDLGKNETRLLALILLIGFLLRVSTILWGTGVMPHTGRYHPDEPKTFEHAVGFPGNYGKDTEFAHGSTVPYLLAAVLLPVKPLVTPPQWEMLCLLGMRLLSVMAGVGSIVLIYMLARHLYDRATALLSAAFTAVSFTHCMNSSFACQDIIVSFLITACFLALFRAVDSRKNLHFVILGLLTGLLLGTKISAAVFVGVIPVLVAVDLARARGNLVHTILQWIRHVEIWAAVALVVFAITSPQILINFTGFLGFWREAKFLWYDRGMVPLSEVPLVWWRITAMTVSMPVLFAFLVGMLVPGTKNRTKNVTVLWFMVLYFLFLRHHVLPRYIASLAPLMCVYAAHACVALARGGWSRTLSKPPVARLLRFAGVGAAAIILAISAWACIRGIRTRLADPRDEAALWLKAHIPPGRTIGFAQTAPPTIEDWQNPPLEGLGLILTPAQTRPEVIIMSSETSSIMEAALQSPYLKNWTWNPSQNANWYNYIPPSSETFKLFDELLNGRSREYRLEANFRLPDTSFRPDFVVGVRIYRRTTSQANLR